MITRYVNTASTAGGDGTTNATSGANRAYATLAAAEAAEQATLTDDIEFLCCGATDDGQCTIDGWTPGSFRINIIGNSGDGAGRHAGAWDTAKYLMTAASGTKPTLETIEDNVTVQGIQITSTHVDGAAVGRFGLVGASVRALNCLFKGPGTTSASTGVAFGDLNNTGTRVKDCIVYNWVLGIQVRQQSAGASDSIIANNTVYGCTTGIKGQDNTASAAYIQAINNLSFGNTTDWSEPNGADFDQANSSHNAYGNSGTACPGSTDINLSTYAAGDIFVNAAGENFHLTSSGSAYSLLDNDGVGPSSNSEVQSTDIDGDARSGTTTSVGADVAAGGGGTTYEVSVSDGLYMYDPTSNKETGRALFDRILLPDTRVGAMDKLLIDGLLVSDRLVRSIELASLELLLLGEAATTEALLAVILRSVSDGLYLFDQRTSEVAKRVLDSPLLSDQLGKNFLRTLFDSVSLVDVRFSAVDRVALDRLFVADVHYRETLRELRDALLLGDSDLLERQAGTGLTVVSISDGLLMFDYLTRSQSAGHGDGFFLLDSAGRDVGLSFAERLLLTDLSSRSAELTFTDRLLVGETLRKILERNLRDQVLLNDSVATSLSAAVVAVLIYALIRQLDPLGAVASHRSAVTYAVDYEDFLGINVSYNMETA